jgi:hypothetical protein
MVYSLWFVVASRFEMAAYYSTTLNGSRQNKKGACRQAVYTFSYIRGLQLIGLFKIQRNHKPQTINHKL